MESMIGVYLGTGLMVSLCSLPMIMRWVPPNRLVGFRTPRTLSGPNVWYPANRIAGQYLAAAGVLIMFAAGIVSVLQKSISTQTASVTLMSLSLGALAAATVLSFLALRRL